MAPPLCTLDARSEYRIYFYKDKRSRHFNAQVSITLGLLHSFFRLCSHRLANVGAPLPPVAPPTYSSPQHSQGSGGNGRGSSHNLSSEHIYASGSANTSMAAITDSLHNTSMPIHFSNHPKQHHTGKKKSITHCFIQWDNFWKPWVFSFRRDWGFLLWKGISFTFSN